MSLGPDKAYQKCQDWNHQAGHRWPIPAKFGGSTKHYATCSKNHFPEHIGELCTGDVIVVTFDLLRRMREASTSTIWCDHYRSVFGSTLEISSGNFLCH